MAMPIYYSLFLWSFKVEFWYIAQNFKLRGKEKEDEDEDEDVGMC